jgi:hypothetical protein
MRYSQHIIRILILRLYGYLLQLYPPRFRAEFSAEIRDIFLNLMLEAEQRGGFWLIKTPLREYAALVISIFREWGHELRSRKETAMVTEDTVPEAAGLPGGGGKYLQTAGGPNSIWVARWTLLTTAAYLAPFIVTVPLAALFLWFINLVGGAKLWPGVNRDNLTMVASMVAYVLLMATIQWVLLRSFLPRSGWWFAATGGGILIGRLIAQFAYLWIDSIIENPNWSLAALYLLHGLVLGFVQWLYLRRFLPNASWIILIDVLAYGSVPLAELVSRPLIRWFEVVGILILPGMITGVGLWLLLRQSKPGPVQQEPVEYMKEKSRRFPSLTRVGLGLAAAAPLYFLCIWIYATSQLALAKSDGIYATVEEAVIAYYSQFKRPEPVVRVEDVYARPIREYGSHPLVWVGEARVYLEGWTSPLYFTNSFYIHVRQGWVPISEEAFPEFIGWVMELYGLEGAKR